MDTISIHTPKIMSKRLAITKYPDGKRKVQISSNFLDAIGMSKGTRVIERKLDSGGYVIELAQSNLLHHKAKHIYRRQYKRRKANPFETVFETTSKAILESIPKTANFVHITMMQGRIIVKSVLDCVSERISKFMLSANPFTAFAMCSSGIDAHAAQSRGFEIVSALDYRPNEARDKRDYTETGMLSFTANVPVQHFFNENIYEVSPKYVQHVTSKAPSNLLIFSAQCDDFTNVKNSKAKEKSVADLTTTIDMIVPALDMVRNLGFSMIMLENVPQFGDSQAGKIWDTQLRRMGYQTYSKVINSLDHGGATGRKRFFHFASILPVEFSWPESITRSDESVYDRFIKGNEERFRDVSHSKSIQDGAKCGRLRVIDRVKNYAPVVLKSQHKQCKDSVVIEGNGENSYLFPDEKLLKQLMTIPDEFDLNIVSSTISTEVIGQGVDYKLYQRLMDCVKRHINLMLDGHQSIKEPLI